MLKHKIRYLSDLHLEFIKPNKIERFLRQIPSGTDEICILAGDIGNPYQPNFSGSKATFEVSSEGGFLVHGLIRCKNGCGYWNRDTNGATNIYRIAYNAINNKARPSYLSRSNLSGNFEEFPKPKFICSVMSKP